LTQSAGIPKKKSRFTAWLKGAKGRSARIAVVYMLAGSAWIVLSDTFAWGSSTDQNSILQLSMVKGLLYVAVTALLIFSLVYATLKKVMVSRETILQMNRALEETSEMYKGLSEAYGDRQALLEALINSIPDQIYYKDSHLRYMGCNRAFAAFTGRDEREILGLKDEDFLEGDLKRLSRRGDEECLRENALQRYEEVVVREGKTLYFETLKTPCHGADGGVIGLIGISRDVTTRRLREERILYLNTHDAATGLRNRAYLTEALHRLDHPEFLPLTVIMGDINGLKMINDTMGHHQGDRVILTAANILKMSLREGDVLARTGGDEFTALLPRTDGAAAQQLVEIIHFACQQGSVDGDELRFLSLSLGWATKREPGESADQVYKMAEDSMYRRKILEHRSLHSSILNSIKKTMLEKSDETEAHAERLAQLSKQLGRALGLPEDDLEALELLSTLHDIGKISVDKNILVKRGPLTEADWVEIKRHPEVGYRIAQASPELIHISDYILTHHERWDGKGYPRGLSGASIPLLARVLMVVDSFDAMTQDRAYRKAMPVEDALEEIRRNAGTQFDPSVAQAFLHMMDGPCADGTEKT
jgi:diguanylate cyclase (GGDEF)-like protein/PAS domain S-box-containing protein